MCDGRVIPTYISIMSFLALSVLAWLLAPITISEARGTPAMPLEVQGPDTEAVMYRGDHSHGLTLYDIPITADGAAARNILLRECSEDGHYTGLSAIRLDHWPVFVMACLTVGFPFRHSSGYHW